MTSDGPPQAGRGPARPSINTFRTAVYSFDGRCGACGGSESVSPSCLFTEAQALETATIMRRKLLRFGYDASRRSRPTFTGWG